MAYELKTNTATRIAVGPLVDPTDGKTAETGLTVTGLSVEIFQIKNDGTAVVRAAFSPTASGGNNDMVHVTDDTTGMYDLELTDAQLNWYGNGRIAFYDVDGFLVHWIDIQVVSASYFNWKYGTTAPEMDLKADAITSAKIADNAFANEHFADGALTSTEITSAGGCVVASIANNAITTASINNDAITAAKIAAGAIDFATFAADCITGTGLKANVESISANAITATAINADAITAAKVHADVSAEIADAVWDEASTGHTDAGKAGQQLWTDVDAILADTNELQVDDTPAALAAIDAKIDTIDGNVDSILTDTGTTLDTKINTIDDFLDTEIAAIITHLTDIKGVGWATETLAAIKLLVDDLETRLTAARAGYLDNLSAGAAALEATAQAILTDTGTTLDAKINTIDDFLDTEIAAIKAKTDLIPASPATEAKQDTIIGYIDTEVAAIKAKTDSLTFTVAGKVDANIKNVNNLAIDGAGTVGDPWGPA